MSAAHPRSRGENDYYPTGATLREGSSPLTRGKQCDIGRAGTLAGLIPAHAGKTKQIRIILKADRAHPRSRGENLASEGESAQDAWLIPAHAGKTASWTTPP